MMPWYQFQDGLSPREYERITDEPIYEGPLEDSSVAYMSFADAFKATPDATPPAEHELGQPWRRIVMTIVDARRGNQFRYGAMNMSNAMFMASIALDRNERAIAALPTQGEYLA